MIKINVVGDAQKAINAALFEIEDRPFSGRHPELGKMVNCRVCGIRHRVNERKCEQVFTYRVGDYELFREDENGELVPDYRTAVRPDKRPTMKQVMGRAAFAKKRFNPHPSRFKLVLIERTRIVFERLGFPLDNKDKEQFQKHLQRARVVATREIKKEQELSDREVRRRQDLSRRMNRGLLPR
jgi:hypothetical protein